MEPHEYILMVENKFVLGQQDYMSMAPIGIASARSHLPASSLIFPSLVLLLFPCPFQGRSLYVPSIKRLVVSSFCLFFEHENPSKPNLANPVFYVLTCWISSLTIIYMYIFLIFNVLYKLIIIILESCMRLGDGPDFFLKLLLRYCFAETAQSPCLTYVHIHRAPSTVLLTQWDLMPQIEYCLHIYIMQLASNMGTFPWSTLSG